MAYNDDEKPPTTNAVAGNKQGLVTMTIPKYSKKDVSLKADSVTAVVEIKATSSTAVREGLDLVAVVDVSGSMAGHKIESAKRALQFVIMKLTPADRLSIVTFNDSADRLNPLQCMTQAAQNELKELVSNKLKAGGRTDIKAGLDLGLSILGGRVHTESRTANIFLMSDGENRSRDDPTETDPGEVSVYTFGFGSGTDGERPPDHELLSNIAKRSVGGTYSFVPDGTNLSAPFAQLLGGLLTVVAQDVRLTLKPKTDDDDLDEMVVAPGTYYTQTTDTNGTITIKFGNLFSGEARRVLVNFTLKDSGVTEAQNVNVTLAEARHSYAAEETRQSPQKILTVRTPNPSSPASAGIEERLVQAEELRRKHADLISQACELAEAQTLENAREKILDGQNSLEEIMLDDGDTMVNVLRAELLQLLAYMASQELYNKLGRPYALATVISHGRQRTAGRGDEEVVISLYITPRMKTYLKQAKNFEENPEALLPTADEDVKQEIAQNPLAAITAPLAFYVDSAIRALQAIQKIIEATST